ncbi:hypothetical protein [Shewanella aestuarii]|uniref:Uncharacterized protein n=1 Tax=Shewanella aestuarii TaxID=1028752 RepID=A0A6G9QPK2_9GAMM|nr:hypothetical protein [Shewanella aestuarii]QIR16348.1 hypothetical protein HBH39_17840 [Shewanella aestuarii]
MKTPQENQNPYLFMAGIARGSSIRRIHTQWRPHNSTINVATFGIPDKKCVVHIARDGRTCLSLDVRILDRYSMATAINQAQEILAKL